MASDHKHPNNQPSAGGAHSSGQAPQPAPYGLPPRTVRAGASSDLHAYARLYGEMGWAVFPCREGGKEPLTERGFQDASTQRMQIDSWWRQWPNANIGIATGKRYSDLVVVDVDPKNGGSLDQLALLCAGEMLPETKTVATGGGGWHLYFRQGDGDAQPEDPDAGDAPWVPAQHLLVPSIVGKVRERDGSIQGLAPGLDTRGEGGYVIAPPSLHPSGLRYLWESTSAKRSILPFPLELAQCLIDHKSAGESKPVSVVGSAPTDSAKVSVGRNTFLTSLGGRLRKDGLTGEALLMALLGANQQFCEPTLSEQEVATIARSVNRYEPPLNNVISQHNRLEHAAATVSGLVGVQSSPDGESVAGTPAAVRADHVPEALRLEAQEREIVAAILVDAETSVPGAITLLEDVATILQPRHLYNAAARSVYAAMFALDLVGKPVTLSLVDAQAKRGAEKADYPGMDAVRGWMNSLTHLEFDPYIHSLCREVEDAARRRMIVTLSKQLHADALGLPGAQSTLSSARELADQATRSLALLSEESHTGERDLAAFIAEYREQLAFWRAHAGQITGASSGLRVIDRQTNGIQPGELWVVGGRASMGKTALALTMLAHNAAFHCEAGESVGIVTLEMSGKSLVHRMIGMASGYAPYNIMTGYGVDDAAIQATLASLASMPLHIMDATTSVTHTNGARGTVTPDVIRARVKYWQRESLLKLVVVDYLQLLRAPQGYAHLNREQQVAEMCTQMKRLAQECNVPVVLLAQLSRATEQRVDRLPQMSDIRESGGVEQDADVILMIFRASYYADRGITVKQESEQGDLLRPASLYTPGIAQIKIEKNRNGPMGVYDAYFDKYGMRYYDWDAHTAAPVDYTGQPVYVQPPRVGGMTTPMGRSDTPPVPQRHSESTANGAHLHYDGASGEWQPTALPYVDDLRDDDPDEQSDDELEDRPDDQADTPTDDRP